MLRNTGYTCVFIQGDDKDKEATALLKHHDETDFDIAERSPAFLNRMQIFKEEFEKIKVSAICMHACTCTHVHTRTRKHTHARTHTYMYV